MAKPEREKPEKVAVPVRKREPEEEQEPPDSVPQQEEPWKMPRRWHTY